MVSEPLAHSGGHLLAKHLLSVAGIAAEFSGEFEEVTVTRRWAYLAGLWHDLGKYRPGFQRYLQQSDNPDAHIEGKVGGREKTHSAAGALWAIETLEKSHGANGKLAANVLAYVIAGPTPDWMIGTVASTNGCRKLIAWSNYKKPRTPSHQPTFSV